MARMKLFIDAIRQELGQLEAEVRADPRHAKIAKLKELLAVYADRASLLHGGVGQPAHGGNGGRTRHESKTERIRREIVKLLSERGTVHRKEILRHLTETGLMGDIKNPMHRLAIYLSGARELFTSDGVGNFSLIETTHQPLGQGVAQELPRDDSR